MRNEKMSGDDVLKVMDTDGRAVALYADTCGTGLRYKQWTAHLKRHDEAREAVAALISERDAAMDICRQLAALRDGLDNSNSSAEEMASRLAHKAQAFFANKEAIHE